MPNALNLCGVGLDGIVHADDFAPASEPEGSFVDVATREGFKLAHEISSDSFTALVQAGKSMMEGRIASILILTYLAAHRTVPNYNLMGPAKASLESNVRYLATSLGT